jgi:AraC-like DNA-binding protein
MGDVGKTRTNLGRPLEAGPLISGLGYIFSEGQMALLAVLAGDRALETRLESALEPRHAVALAHSWGGLVRLVRERPATGAIVDLETVTPLPSSEGALANLRAQFPHLGLVLLVRRFRDPFTLFRLGRAGIRNLVLLPVDDLDLELNRALNHASEGNATSLVTRFLSPSLPRRERRLTFLAMDSVHRRWSAEELAREMSLTRPFLSERMKIFGLPSLGHFLLWTRLFHAGHWLEEPGRTGESIGRQLEYSSGAAFRRALKHYTGATPTQVRQEGGLHLVLGHFFRRTGLPAPRFRSRVSLV